jgi:tRNA 2-selenouridine synthase SelU
MYLLNAMTRYCTFSLPDEVADRLDESDVDNKSGEVAKALKEYYDL